MRMTRPFSIGPSWAAILALLLAACGGSSLEGTSDDVTGSQGAPLATTRVRLVAANITSGNAQSYDPGEGTRIFQGIQPDVAMIQEFNYGSNSTADIRSFVNTAFGSSFYYYRGGGGVQIPNGVISRYPILAAGDWTDTQVGNRAFTWARIDLPGPTDLWAISVHLLTASASVRNTEAANLVNFIKTNVPAGAYVAIGGDYNSDSRSEALFSTFSSVVSTASPYPADKNANTNTNASRGKPYDHVLVSSNLRAYQTATVIGASSFSAGLVVDTRVYSPLSEISPAKSTDSGSTNMQHMAVVKDFLVPSDTTPASSITVTSPNGGEGWVTGSSHAITWTSSGVTNVKVEYSLNGSTWTALTSSTPASTGSYSWTLPTTASTSAWVRVSDASNSATTDSSNAAFSITSSGGGGGAAQVFINEILANEAGSDVNGEFIELVNSGGTAADLSGWTLSDATGVRHTFASGTSLAAGKAIVVFGASAGIPSGTVNAVGCTSGGLNLSNSGDTVTLKNGSGTTVDTTTYGSSLAGSDGVSMNRSTDGVSGGSFVLHTSLSSAASSPGTRANGTAY